MFIYLFIYRTEKRNWVSEDNREDGERFDERGIAKTEGPTGAMRGRGVPTDGSGRRVKAARHSFQLDPGIGFGSGSRGWIHCADTAPDIPHGREK
jgi:hypothetical protein